MCFKSFELFLEGSLASNCLLGKVKLLKNTCQDSARGVILGHLGDVDSLEGLTFEARRCELKSLVLEHLCVDVTLLKLHVGDLDLVGAILGDLLVLEIVLESLLLGFSLLNDQALLVLLHLHIVLISSEFEFEVHLVDLEVSLSLLGLLPKLHLDTQLLLLLKELRLLKEELLLFFLHLHVDPVKVLLSDVVSLAHLLSDLERVLAAHLIQLGLHFHGVEGCLLAHRLAEVRLHVSKQRLGADLNACDLNGFEPDTPALDSLFHLFGHGVAEKLTVLDHLHDGGVCDAGAHDRLSL